MTDYLIFLAKLDAVALIFAALYLLTYAGTRTPDGLDDRLAGLAAGLWICHLRILLAPYFGIRRLATFIQDTRDLKLDRSNPWRIP